MIHSSDVRQVLDALEVTSLSLVQPIKSTLLDELSDDLQSDLITPLIDEGHTHIVDEDRKLFVLRWSIFLTHLVIAFLLDGCLEQTWWCSWWEVNSLEELNWNIEFQGPHQHGWSLGCSRTSDQKDSVLYESSWRVNRSWLSKNTVSEVINSEWI